MQPGQQADPKQLPAPGSPADRQRQAALKQALAETRRSMSEHDLAAAQRHLETADAQARTPEERAELDRLETLLGHLVEFWKAMRRIVAGLEATETLAVGETFVAVVEADAEQLTIQVEGRPRTYQIDRLPFPVVQSLADTKFAADAATKVIVGTYYLVDPDGDPVRARRLWTEAAQQGIDVEDLIPELRLWTGPSAARRASTQQRTAPPTDQRKLQDAERAVQERFQADYAEATGIAAKARLATKLLTAAQATTDDVELRFVLLREARDAAIAAGDSELALQAIDRITMFHQIDALAMKVAALGDSAKNARGLDSQKAIARAAMKLATEALEAKRLKEAGELGEVALSAARASKSRPLMEQAMHAIEQIETLRAQREAAKASDEERPSGRQPPTPTPTGND
jgi:hypothetical protein